MAVNIDDLLPTAKEIQKQAALKEAEKAGQHAERLAAAEAEKRALIERLSKPSGLTEDEKVKLASTVIQRAVRNGLTEVQVFVAGDTTNDIEIVRIHPLAICVPNFDDERDGQREIVEANSVSPQHIRRVGAGIDHFRSPRGVPE